MKTESYQGAHPGAPSATSGSDPAARAPSPGEKAPPAQALHDIPQRLAEIREYVSFYLAAKADAMKLSLRNAVFYAALGVVGLIAGAAVVVVSVVLMLVGAAHGIGAGLGGRPWLGDLIVGVGVMVVLGLVMRLAISKVFGASRKKTVEKYESRKRDQRNRFGRDVHE